MSQLSLHLLGASQACLDGQPIVIMRIKARALLIYLGVECDRPQRREALCTLLWPGMPEKSARHNLNQTVYSLRKLIPAHDGETEDPIPQILSDRQTVQLNPDGGINAQAGA